jgi:hypothetical protein
MQPKLLLAPAPPTLVAIAVVVPTLPTLVDVALNVVAVAKQALNSMAVLAKKVATMSIGTLAAATPAKEAVAADVVLLVDVAEEEPGFRLAGKERPRGACLKCGSTQHQVLGCPDTQPGEAERLLAELRARRAAPAAPMRRVETMAEPGDGVASAEAPSGAVEARVDGLEVHALLLDTGADASLVAQGVVDAIKARGTPVFLADIPPRTLSPIGGQDFTVRRAVTFREVELATSAGPLMLRNLACLVEDDNKSLDVTLGRPIMTVLGYSADKLLVGAHDTKSEWEFGDVENDETDVKTTALQRLCRMQTRARDIALDTMALERLVNDSLPGDMIQGGGDLPDTFMETENLQHAYWQLPISSSEAEVLAIKVLGDHSHVNRVPAGVHAMATENADAVERHETRTALPSMRLSDVPAVKDMLEKKLASARAKGLSPNGVKRLRAILLRRQDSFRLEFGSDPPVKVAPLQGRVKIDAQPTKAQPRRYSPDDRAILDRHTSKLLEFGLVFLNDRSRWASAPRIVRKKEQDTDPMADPRMTIDTRGVNERTEAMPWPMPVLEVVLGVLGGAKVFFALDWFRGYWQLPLHKDSQELFTFITHRGMYTPTRVPMGATDAVAYCQGVVEEIFGDLLGNGILAWLDDILGYAESEDALLELLDNVLARCEAYGLKLHAKKCDFFELEVKWCGKMVSAAGVRHCPDRVQGLVEMQPPRTAGDLQQFLCAVNWMRQSIPEYNRLTAGLYAALEQAMKTAGSRKKAKLAKLPLDQIDWGDQQLADLAAVQAALLKMVPLAHPSPNAEVCLYTDASQDSWGAVATQLKPGEAQLPLEQQNHRPLAFLSGRFVGASSHWPTIEKEAYAIVEATRRLEYLLLSPGGFRLYTDHRTSCKSSHRMGPTLRWLAIRQTSCNDGRCHC